ncbi:MAG: hypothetical protein WCI72_03025 [archaeon]
MELSDKLKATVYGLAGVVNVADAIHIIKEDFLPPLSSYVGNANESFGWPAIICIATEAVGKKFPKLKSVTNYTPEVAYGAMALYNILGETVFDIIPLNVKDPLDIPTALISCLAGYFLYKSIQDYNI